MRDWMDRWPICYRGSRVVTTKRSYFAPRRDLTNLAKMKTKPGLAFCVKPSMGLEFPADQTLVDLLVRVWFPCCKAKAAPSDAP